MAGGIKSRSFDSIEEGDIIRIAERVAGSRKPAPGRPTRAASATGAPTSEPSRGPSMAPATSTEPVAPDGRPISRARILQQRPQRVRGAIEQAAPGTIGSMLGRAGLGTIARIATGPVGLAVTAALIAKRVISGVIGRRERAIDSLVESRGTEFLADAVYGNKDIPGMSREYAKMSTAWRTVQSELSSVRVGLASLLDGDGLEHAQLLARHEYWKKQRIPPRAVRLRNQLERERFDRQMDLGGEWFGGWGKMPEVIGG